MLQLERPTILFVWTSDVSMDMLVRKSNMGLIQFFFFWKGVLLISYEYYSVLFTLKPLTDTCIVLWHVMIFKKTNLSLFDALLSLQYETVLRTFP